MASTAAPERPCPLPGRRLDPGTRASGQRPTATALAAFLFRFFWELQSIQSVPLSDISITVPFYRGADWGAKPVRKGTVVRAETGAPLDCLRSFQPAPNPGHAAARDLQPLSPGRSSSWWASGGLARISQAGARGKPALWSTLVLHLRHNFIVWREEPKATQQHSKAYGAEAELIERTIFCLLGGKYSTSRNWNILLEENDFSGPGADLAQTHRNAAALEHRGSCPRRGQTRVLPLTRAENKVSRWGKRH